MTAFRPWRIVHHDLASGLPSLSLSEGVGGVYLVLWLGDVPLGHLEIPAEWLPLGAAELRDRVSQVVAPAVAFRLGGFEPSASVPALTGDQSGQHAPELAHFIRDRPLERLAEKIERERRKERPGSRGAVSVVVCTRDRPDDLARCLAALLRCVPAPDEIIVVDNAPQRDATRKVVEQFAAVRYVPEPRPGLSAARNRGIRSADGEIIAFTDDDVEVHPHWVERVRQSFTRPDVLAVTGLVLPARLDAEPQWIFEKEFGGFGQGYQPIEFGREFFHRGRQKGTRVWHIGAGANMAFRRRAFQEVGLFDERLGAGAAGCSEDSELWYRLLANGWVCRYDPTAVVFHHHRAEIAALRSQMYSYMRGHVATLLVQAQRHRDAGNLYRLFFLLPAHYLKRTLLLRGFESEIRHRMIPHEIRGCFAGIGYFLRHPRGAPPRLSAPSQQP